MCHCGKSDRFCKGEVTTAPTFFLSANFSFQDASNLALPADRRDQFFVHERHDEQNGAQIEGQQGDADMLDHAEPSSESGSPKLIKDK